MPFPPPPTPRALRGPALLGELLISAAVTLARQAPRAFRAVVRSRRGHTLRPGNETPLWNALRAQLRPLLRRRGRQARLARLLGLSRQRLNRCLAGGTAMPDAERTLELLVWLRASRREEPPARTRRGPLSGRPRGMSSIG